MKQITVVVILLTMIPLIASIGITPALTNIFAAVNSNDVEIQKQDLRGVYENQYCKWWLDI